MMNRTWMITMGPPWVKKKHQFRDIHLTPKFPWPNPDVWWSNHWLHPIFVGVKARNVRWSNGQIMTKFWWFNPHGRKPSPHWFFMELLPSLDFMGPHLRCPKHCDHLHLLLPGWLWGAGAKSACSHRCSDGGPRGGMLTSPKCGWATKPSSMMHCIVR